MILIFSEEVDMSTDSVCEWIDYLGGRFKRLNGSVFTPDPSKFTYALQLDNRNGLDVTFFFKGKPLPASKIRSVWFRRDEPTDPYKGMDGIRDRELRHTLLAHSQRELVRAKEYFFVALLQKPHLGNHLIKEMNKFQSLLVAAKHGLDIPLSLLSNDLATQRRFVEKQPTINKAIRETDFFKSSQADVFVSYTSGVTKPDLSDNGFPSFLQGRVEKDFEIRVFYLKGRFYPMAIFSQKDTKTAVDYRRYNLAKPNRNVPYRLPGPVQEALHNTMQELGLDNGSIDLIKTPDGKYVFLEVNPVGQFGMTSKPCNYYIEKEIAHILLHA